MLGRMRPRRSLWLGLGLGLTIAAAAAAVAIAAQGPANLAFTPHSERQIPLTSANLQNDGAGGLHNIDTVTISGKTVPEVNANYQAPTPIDSQHGGFSDGLFTKPPVGSYPAYLNQPQFCASAIAASA